MCTNIIAFNIFRLYDFYWEFHFEIHYENIKTEKVTYGISITTNSIDSIFIPY